MGAGHRYHVEQVVGDGVARSGDVGNTRGVEDRQPDLAPERADLRQERRQRLRHAGHIVLGQRQIGVHAAEDGIEEIDMPLALEQLGEPHTFLEADALLDVLVDDEADAHDIVVADALADGFVHHQAEARAVLQRAAEGVGPPIGARRQELADQMAAGDGLAAIEATFPAAQCCGGIVGDDAVDVVAVHLARDVAMA